MKVKFNFSNEDFPEEDITFFKKDKSIIEWNCFALPRAGDHIDTILFEEVYNEQLEDMERFLWVVDCIEWIKEGKDIIPIIWVTGS